MKIKLRDDYPNIEINLGMGCMLRKGDIVDVAESYELKQAIDLGYVEEVKDEKKSGKIVRGSQEIWIFAEQRDSKLAKPVFELAGIARKLAEKSSVSVGAVLLCGKDNGMSAELIAHGIDKVYLAEDKRLEEYQTDVYKKTIADLIKEHKPQIVLYSATNAGRELAPRIAQNIDAGLTADCIGLDIDKDGFLVQTKPAFGDNVMATIKCKTKPQMSTVRPGVMKMPSKDENRKGNIVKIKPEIAKPKTRSVNRLKADGKAKIEEARIIIAVGRGVCKNEDFEMLKKLALILGAEIGASRGAVDSGFVKKERQIGQTGKTVKPKLYIACGVSGAVQHTVGMQESDMIIAINKDPNAMIFNIADYGIVGDVHQVIPALIKSLQGE